jgi:hypothetical protein
LSGGRCLFDTFEQAREYERLVEQDFILDGMSFFDRPNFLNPDCHALSVIGAHDFADIHMAQVILRTERWRVPADNRQELLRGRWPALRDEAGARGLTNVWLLYNKQEQLAALVYFADRAVLRNPLVPDFASLASLEFAPPL